MVTSTQPSFRFFDNREKYLLFVNTCNEKQVIAERVAQDARRLRPAQPALSIFDAGMGDATVLTRVMRSMHHRFPTVPHLVVGKEISHEDVRLSLDKMADRFYEHPLTVLVMTNMRYTEARRLYPQSPAHQDGLNWMEVSLKGSSAFEFDQQISDLTPRVQDLWQTVPSERTGNPVYAEPSVLVIYRADHEWPLARVVPRQGCVDHRYDVIIAAQPFRARAPAGPKVRNVLAPLARSLAPGGFMVVIQSTGKDPGMEIVRRIWPDEAPFQTPRETLLRELRAQIGDTEQDLRFLSPMDSRALFRYNLQLPSREESSSIGTSTLLAAWNAVTYVAQVDDDRLRQAMGREEYLDVTSEVLEKYGGLWFTDESFVVSRLSGDRG